MTSHNDALDARAMTIAEDALAEAADRRINFIVERSGGDRVLRERAIELLRNAEREDAEALATGGGAALLRDQLQPARIGAFRIVREIGRGGMGVVYLGERDGADFEHLAAIKLVSRKDVEGALVERLRFERRMLARLKHPNIAHFYDGGETEDGHPYFAMEYVEGNTLSDFLKSASPPMVEKLRLFADICAAVSYAHRNLIIHRDLSAANILITEDRVAKVIDFGVSHAIGEEANSVSLGMTATKGFTAPERLRGEPATTLSDIYSLGVILEKLIGNEDAPRIADLTAIAAKAQADDPAERYQSVGEFISDINRYTDEMAVRARGDNWRYILFRFIQRRKLAVGAASFVFVAALLGAAAMTTLYFRAETAEAQATKRFEETRALAKTLMFGLYDDLAAIPGTSAARERVAATAQTYLDALSETPGAPFDLELETAIGYRRLADIVGVPSGVNLGRLDEVAPLLDKAMTQLSALKSRAPDDPSVLRAYAEAAYSYVIYEWFGADDSPATIEKAELAEAAYGRLETLGVLTDEDAAVLVDIMSIHASAYIWEDQSEDGLEVMRRALAKSAELFNGRDNGPAIVRARARLAVNYGDALARNADITDGGYDEALRYLDQGLEQLRALSPQQDEDMSLARLLASSLWKRANVLYEVSRNEEAVNDLGKAEAIYRRFYEQDTEDLGAYRNLSIVTMQKARSLHDLGRHEEAARVARESLDARIYLASLQPDNVSHALGVAESKISFAEILHAGGETAEACAVLREGLAEWNALQAEGQLSAYSESLAIEDDAPVMKACPG